MLERLVTLLIEKAIAWLWAYLVEYGKRQKPKEYTHGRDGNCPTCRQYYDGMRA